MTRSDTIVEGLVGPALKANNVVSVANETTITTNRHYRRLPHLFCLAAEKHGPPRSGPLVQDRINSSRRRRRRRPTC